jgi:hypothetical protein
LIRRAAVAHPAEEPTLDVITRERVSAQPFKIGVRCCVIYSVVFAV